MSDLSEVSLPALEDEITVRLGRKTRTIPVTMRRALKERDGGCRFPGCEHRRFLHAHHIRHWARGGETALGSLVLLCTRHHRLLQEGGYSVDHRVRFYDPRGRPIRAAWKAPPVGPGGLRLDEPTRPHAGAAGTGERMSLDLVVLDLLAAAGG